ncbi:MAG TPA: PAS domain S-box protein, partial [Polyangiaceae bacterium]|nr:PAS domain S-box protein [Polyangiaceae bacterium]
MDDANERVGWPVGAGEAGRLMRARDWSNTALGEPERWPQCLKSALDLMLASGFPMLLLYGREYIVFYNDAFRPLLGAHHPRAFGRPALESHSEIRTASEEIRARVWNGETLTFRDRHFRVSRDSPDEDAWFDVSYSPLRDEAQAVAGLVAVATETTARALAERRRDEVEAELRDREARQRILVELGDRTRDLRDPHAVMAVTVELLGRHLSVGRVGYGEIDDALAVFDIKAEWSDGALPSFVGKSSIAQMGAEMLDYCRSGRVWFSDDVERDERPFVRLVSEAYIDCGARAAVSVPLLNAGRWVGSLYATSLTARAWKDSEIALLRDVADRTWVAVERARAETVLRESEAKFRAITEQAEAGIAMSDLDGRIIYANERLGEMVGRSIVGQTIQDLTHAADWPRNKLLFERMLVHGEPFTLEKRLVARDDRVLWSRVTVSARRDARGTIVGGMAVMLDMTDRKAAEAERARAEAAVAADLRGTRLLRDLSARLVPEGDTQVMYDEILQAAIVLSSAQAGIVQVLDEETR